MQAAPAASAVKPAPAAKAKPEPAKKPETPKKPASAAKKPAEAAKKPEAAKLPPKPQAVKAQAVSAPPSRPLPQPVKPPDPKPAAPSKAVPIKPSAVKVKVEFSAGDYVVYPTHGVGKVLRIERQSIAGFELDLMVVEFERDKMTVRVPTTKVQSVGIRKLSSPQKMRTALDTLKGRARVKRAMWSRRAQEYEAKINSGDPVAIAEVVRDLHRNAGQPDQSYSERQIYESALDRLVRELAAVERIDEDSAAKKLDKHLKAA
ncbi:CarD family transcriptional regulator [Ferrovibrio sp.]|uniref:CarD family transcriptional regulator n=1 Tax=Ferrovibrio sp. TaxID=1917215 RepID=UPI0025C3D588|nr:CarD family transcriptional regulator [Ferrovibrio sp.]MBX3455208.1 CarD family transcriptional regulator [Ferrovibrio sp.]